MKRSAFFILLIIIHFVLIADEKLICDYCHEPITGEYIKVGDKVFHPEHFLCSWCGKQIKSNDFIEYNGKFYHKNCFYNYVVPKCAVCGKPIKGAYIKNYWGEIYHAYHKDEIITCSYCSRIVKHPHKDKNGLYVCDICKKKLINDEFDAKQKIREISKILYKFGINVDIPNINIHLVYFKDFKSKINNPNITSDNKGMAEYKIRKYPNGKVEKFYDIYILKGMPDFTFVEVAAHELMHIWIYENGEKGQEASLVEGSCNYASYLVLNELKKDFPFRMIKLDKKDIEYEITKLNENPDPIYGGGFRQIKKYAEKFGIFMWLNYLQHHKNLPKNF